MKLIVGLGNPGPDYAGTRHNVGFMAVNLLAEQLGVTFSKQKHFAEIAETRWQGEKVLLMKPQTFMNCSGEAVADAVNYYHLDWSEDVLVIFDDMDLACGLLRVRQKGSAGGHRGMGNILQHGANAPISRIKIGIDHPLFGTVVDYVLQRFSAEEMALIRPALDLAAKACCCWLEHGIKETMNQYNGYGKQQPKTAEEENNR